MEVFAQNAKEFNPRYLRGEKAQIRVKYFSFLEMLVGLFGVMHWKTYFVETIPILRGEKSACLTPQDN